MSDNLPWEHMLERARTNGLLGKQLFVVFTMPEDGMEPIMANIKEHLAYQRMLEDTGVMFAAGPMADMSGDTWSLCGQNHLKKPKPSLRQTRCMRRGHANTWCVPGL